uniref:hypothetical protein n=1 Tax=Acetomicrobium sp. S15 = DSM 107314 TaxID=2529858 RepID=UPI001E5EABCD
MAREDANELISLDPNLEEFPSLKAKLLASLGEGLSLALTDMLDVVVVVSFVPLLTLGVTEGGSLNVLGDFLPSLSS